MNTNRFLRNKRLLFLTTIENCNEAEVRENKIATNPGSRSSEDENKKKVITVLFFCLQGENLIERKAALKGFQCSLFDRFNAHLLFAKQIN